MTKSELYEQLRRFQARKLPGWTNAECRTMTEGWHPKFAHIDADLCRLATTIELGREGFPSVDRVLARAKEAQRQRNDDKKRAEPEPRPDPMVGRIGVRAARIMWESSMPYADAEARATAEIEAEEAGKGGAK